MPVIWLKPWQRLRRFVHLLWHTPNLFRNKVHRAEVSWISDENEKVLSVMIHCSCGKVFW